jgi:hypothetical protein
MDAASRSTRSTDLGRTTARRSVRQERVKATFQLRKESMPGRFDPAKLVQIHRRHPTAQPRRTNRTTSEACQPGLWSWWWSSGNWAGSCLVTWLFRLGPPTPDEAPSPLTSVIRPRVTRYDQVSMMAPVAVGRKTRCGTAKSFFPV